MAHGSVKRHSNGRDLEKGLVYFAILDALEASGGCVLCTLEVQATGRYFDSLLSENVNDSGIRRELLKSRGYCARHVRWLLEKEDPLGTAILYRDQVAAFAESLDVAGGFPAHGHSSRPVRLLHSECPACLEQVVARERYAEEFRKRFTADDEFRTAFESSAGLCLPHLRCVIERTGDRNTRQRIIDTQRKRLGGLLAQLDEFIRKQDYRFAGEGIGAEGDSWRRAAEMIAGDTRLF